MHVKCLVQKLDFFILLFERISCLDKGYLYVRQRAQGVG